MKTIVLAYLLAIAPLAGLRAADTLHVPLMIDLDYLSSIAATSLDLDAEGRSELAADACNRLVLSDARLSAPNAMLELSMAMTAHTGASLLGRCAGLRPVARRLHVTLTPDVDERGSAALFRVSTIELRNADGQTDVLSTAVRLLTERLLLPRLETMKVELAEPLSAIDQLVEDFLPGTQGADTLLIDRSRLDRIEVLPGGVRAVLSFDLDPPAHSVLEEPALDPTELAQWQRIEDELDGFLTVVIVNLAGQLEDRGQQRDLQLDLLAVLLDARRQIAEALTDDRTETDSIRRLFLDSWTALRPLLRRADELGIAESVDLRMAGFLAAGDALQAIDGLGPAYGLEVSRDGLRRLARLLLAEQAPDRFTPLPLTTDPALRQLFRITDPPAARKPKTMRNLWWPQFISIAHADTRSPAEALRGMVPRPEGLDDYLALVARLIAETLTDHAAEGTRVPVEYRAMFDPLVRATAWKESCWRHYEGTGNPPRVIRSSVGAIGMMQIMGRVWRGVYEIDRLENEADYNVAAGIEILEHYLVDYAIRRGEHERPGGPENLVRATYAAYNGGPSQLSRYRLDQTPARLRAIDNAFWRDFERMRSEPWPEVSECYGG